MKKIEEKIKQKQSAQDKFFNLFVLFLSGFGLVWYENRNNFDVNIQVILTILLILSFVLLIIILYLYNEKSDLINKL